MNAVASCLDTVHAFGVRSLLVVGLVAIGAVTGCSSPDATESSDGSEQVSEVSRELRAIQDEMWADAIASSAALRFREGFAIEHLDDLSFGDYQRVVELARGWVERLEALDRSALSHEEWVDARALAWDLDNLIEGERWFWHDSVLTSYRSPLPGLAQLLAGQPLGTEEEREAYLGLLGQVPRFVSQLRERVEGQAGRGIYVWGPNFDASVQLVRAMRSADGSGPFSVDPSRVSTLPEAERMVFLAQVKALAKEGIDSQLDQLAEYLEGEYREGVPEGVGATQLPDGEEYYRYAVRRSTTMDVSPEEIHRRGSALVEEMETEMAALRNQAGFEGSREEFRESLRTDPKFFPKAPDEVGERLMAAADSMEEVVEQYFETRPEAPYGVKRLDPSLEGSQTYGFYQPPTSTEPRGLYNYNGSKLNERSWLNLAGVSLHELIPGHHFHIARQFENQRLGNYRRNTLHGAYTEGWGSYASVLGLEAGIYSDDPYSAYGMYMLEVFLATRLVVDTGMNLLGWSLEEGREFMREHTLESETQIATESLRYSADMPAQALAYQMGKLEFLELRERAQAALGERFDLPAFHEALLENGSLPMAVLEEHVDWWIEQQRE